MNTSKYAGLFFLLLAASWLETAYAKLPAQAQAIIEHFDMQKIPHEGPWFLQTHKSDEVIEGQLAQRYAGTRYAYTAIYAVATREAFSAMHRLKTDELWHFYGGSPSELLMLYPDGSGEIKVFGADVLAGQAPQIMVPRGTWMGARPIGPDDQAYTFASNTLSPGFEYEDYEIGYRDELIAKYPKFADKIIELTRDDSLTRPRKQRREKAKRRIAVEELVGRRAKIKSAKMSVAKFTIDPATKTPASLNVKGHEVIIVDSGVGVVTVGGKRIPVQRGSVVLLPPGVQHKVMAKSYLVFYAVVSPAYADSDHFVIEP